jgi:two-component system cell cycle sensor histidine kinase/response regulator CckA
MSEPLYDAASAAEIVASSGDAILGVGPDGIIMEWNPAAEAVYGYTAAEAIGQPFRYLVPIELHDIERRRFARAANGERTRVAAAPRIRRDGVRVLVASSMFPIRDERQAIVGVGVIDRDVTRERAMEAELLEAKRMETLGRLARGVAHEVNDINTTILGLADFVAKRVANDPAAWEDLDEIRKQARRASRLARHLLAFGTRPATRRGYVDINASLRGMESLLQSVVSERVRIESELAAGELLITADENQLEVMLFELALCVSEAVRGRGRIRIATQFVHVDADVLPVPAGVPPGDYVCVAMRGREANAAVAEGNTLLRQESSEFGMLSLTVVSSVLDAMHGHLVLGEARGQARVYLPAVGLPPRTAAPRREDDVPGETILLVEDEAAVRDVIGRALREHGFYVLEARDGEHALDVAEAHGAPIHLVISDVIMPKMDGCALFQRLRTWYPHLRFLFVSGYTSGALGAAELRGETADFLAKPFSAEALYATVRALLDRTASH